MSLQTDMQEILAGLEDDDRIDVLENELLTDTVTPELVVAVRFEDEFTVSHDGWDCHVTSGRRFAEVRCKPMSEPINQEL